MCSHISKFGQNRGISALFLSRISTMLKFGTQKANHRFTVACQIRPSMLWVWEPHQYFKIGQIRVFCPCRRDAMLLHSQPQLHLLHVYIISNFLIVTFAITTTGVYTFTTTTAGVYAYSLYMRACTLLVPCLSHPQYTSRHAKLLEHAVHQSALL